MTREKTSLNPLSLKFYRLNVDHFKFKETGRTDQEMCDYSGTAYFQSAFENAFDDIVIS